MGDHLPELPGSEGSLQHLESRAIAQRLDLQAARMQLDLVGQSLALRTKMRYVPAQIRIGVDTEKEPDGQRVTGPTNCPPKARSNWETPFDGAFFDLDMMSKLNSDRREFETAPRPNG